MGKNSGGVTDWHKKQHKKQLAKNKEARIAARDERVVQEKTVQDVRGEIRKLEQQYKNEQQRPHHIQSKLDRLKKELKLVTTKEEADKQQRELTLHQQKTIHDSASQPFVPLERPEVSVYFDAVMNPFGVPPPGQPKLYYRRGGGTTMNLNEACTPQEQFQPPPPPPPQQRQAPQMHQAISQRPTPRGDSSQNLHQSRIFHRGGNAKVEVEAKTIGTLSSPVQEKVVSPSQLPSLPAPSAAVARMKQNRLTTDIWASQEEIDYEEQVSATSLEGVIGPSSAMVHSVWFYRDRSGVVQGPFTTDQMRQWNQAGYFPKTTPVSGTNNSGPWRLFSEIKQLNDAATKEPRPSHSKKSSSVQDRIAALRQNNVSSQRNMEVSSPSASSHAHDGVDYGPEKGGDSVQNRISALEAQPFSNDVAEVRIIPGNEDQKQQNGMDSFTCEGNENDADENVEAMTVQDRIAALRAHHILTVTEDEVGEQSEYHRYGNGNLPVPPPPPPPPPQKDAAVSAEIPLYPVDDIVTAYPIDHDEKVDISDVYEVDEEHVTYPFDHEYPVTGDYGNGNDEYPMNQSEYYPVTDPYDGTIEGDREPPKKKVKVDKAIVSLVPSRVRKR